MSLVIVHSLQTPTLRNAVSCVKCIAKNGCFLTNFDYVSCIVHRITPYFEDLEAIIESVDSICRDSVDV